MTIGETNQTRSAGDQDKLQSNEFAKQKAVELLARWPVEEYLSHRYWENNRDHATALLAQIAPLLTAVKVKPLVWEYVSITNTWQAKCELGEYSVGFDDGWWAQLEGATYWDWDSPEDPRSYIGPISAQFAAQADYQARILAAVEAVPIAQTVAAERAACTEELRLAVAAARAEERELAAKVAEGCPDSHWAWWVADAIRARLEGGGE